MISLQIDLPGEDVRTIDVNVEPTQMTVYTHRFKARIFFPKPVVAETASSKFYSDKSRLEVVTKSAR